MLKRFLENLKKHPQNSEGERAEKSGTEETPEIEKYSEATETTETTALATVDATPAGIMEVIEIADYSQFLYNANMGGKPVTDFTSEGIETISLQYGISTGPVEIQFLDDGNAAIFTSTATHFTACDRQR